jgi:hypothetical protein
LEEIFLAYMTRAPQDVTDVKDVPLLAASSAEIKATA